MGMADFALGFAVIGYVASPVLAEEMARTDITADSVEWVQVAPDVEIGPLWGDAEAGAYGRFVKFGPGHFSPLHSHSNAYHAAVVQGTIKEVVDGAQDGPELSAGSYYHSPANEAHTTECISAEACIIYEQSDNKFDMTFIE